MLPQEVATSNKHQLYKTLEHIVFPVPQQQKKSCSTLRAICCRLILFQKLMLAVGIGSC